MRFLVIVAAMLGIAACAAPADPRDVLTAPFNAADALYARLPPPPTPLALRPPPAQPGHLVLSNFNYDRAHVEALVTPYPDCEPREGTASSNFQLPLNGTWVADTPAGSDVCWRRELPVDTTNNPPRAPRWTGWNRAFLSSGRIVDSQL
jgi:hypothetical protein